MLIAVVFSSNSDVYIYNSDLVFVALNVCAFMKTQYLKLTFCFVARTAYYKSVSGTTTASRRLQIRCVGGYFLSGGKTPGLGRSICL